jgi:hypothetical protein
MSNNINMSVMVYIYASKKKGEDMGFGENQGMGDHVKFWKPLVYKLSHIAEIVCSLA